MTRRILLTDGYRCTYPVTRFLRCLLCPGPILFDGLFAVLCSALLPAFRWDRPATSQSCPWGNLEVRYSPAKLSPVDSSDICIFLSSFRSLALVLNSHLCPVSTGWPAPGLPAQESNYRFLQFSSRRLHAYSTSRAHYQYYSMGVVLAPDKLRGLESRSFFCNILIQPRVIIYDYVYLVLRSLGLSIVPFLTSL